MSPFARCLQTAAAVARKILEKAAEEELKEEEEKAAEVTAANADGGAALLRRRPPPPPSPLVVEIDVSVCEVLSRDCMGGRDPPDGADPGLWAWGGATENGKGGSESEGEDGDLVERRLLSAAAAVGLPRELTSFVSRSSGDGFASYPETRGEAGTRYLIALASAAARALAAGAGGRKAGAEEEENGDDDKSENNPNEKEKEQDKKQGSESPTATPITMVVTHGEAVVAAMRMTAEKGKPYAVPPTGVVVLDVFVEEEGGGDNGNSSALAAAASAVACARWELSEAARGVAFE